MIEQSSNLLYSISMYSNCQNCFGCTGLRHKEYCVFNKQYSKDEYEALVAKIIEHMQQTGEWGEYFPINHSPYGYNESLAQDFYPLTKEEALAIGANWQDEDFLPYYDGSVYSPEPIEKYKDNQGKVDEALADILKCKISNKPFKLQSGELAFYIKNDIQIPNLHPDRRYTERFKLTNPLKTWHRQCDCNKTGHGHNNRCNNEFKTSYAPDRPEKVFCEDCYQKEII